MVFYLNNNNFMVTDEDVEKIALILNSNSGVWFNAMRFSDEKEVLVRVKQLEDFEILARVDYEIIEEINETIKPLYKFIRNNIIISKNLEAVDFLSLKTPLYIKGLIDGKIYLIRINKVHERMIFFEPLEVFVKEVVKA